MDKFIQKVTVTGADGSVLPEDLLKLSERYPFVEFGILLSKNRFGSPRYPSLQWLDRLFSVFSHVSPKFLSAHLCGEIARSAFQTDHFSSLFKNGHLDRIFGRIQFNCTFQFDEQRSLDAIKIVQRHTKMNRELIFLFNPTHEQFILDCKNLQLKISTLFDTSHGTGKLPNEWVRPPYGLPCGFAGGLSPENVVREILQIKKIVDKEVSWIDAESHLRSENDHVFDLKKVESFLLAAEPWVKSSG